MRKPTFAILLILLSVVSGVSQSEAEWIKFTPPEKSFSLSLPGEPEAEVVPEPTKHNRYVRYEKGYGFVIEYFDGLEVMDSEKGLDETRDGITKAMAAKLTRETKLSLDGYAGRELEFVHTLENGVEVVSRVRIYYGNGRLYSMAYIWRKDMDATLVSRINDKYFSSIKIAAIK